jgi:hypothetical protein
MICPSDMNRELEIIGIGADIVRAALIKHLELSGRSLTSFCVENQLYQSNIYLFVRGKNLSTPTLQRLANILKKLV